MSLNTYTVRCAKGHDAVELTGQDALDHIQACLGRKYGTIAVPKHGAPFYRFVAWKPAYPAKATPWKAPRQAPLSKAVLDAMASGDVTVEQQDGPVTAAADLRAGDVFYLAGRTYTLHAITDAGFDLEIAKRGRRPAHRSVVPADRFTASLAKVTRDHQLLLVKRAA